MISQQLRFSLLLLTPSLVSGLAAIIITALALALPAWSFVEDNPFLYEFLYGEDGLVTALNGSPESASTLWSSLVSLPASYNISIVLIAAGLGLATFLTLQLVNKVTGTVHSLRSLRFFPTAFRISAEKEFALRTAVRMGALLLWLAFCLATVKLLWPFCVLSVRTSMGFFPELAGWSHFATGAGLLLLVAHMHVIFLRLIALRPRLFGGGYYVRYE